MNQKDIRQNGLITIKNQQVPVDFQLKSDLYGNPSYSPAIFIPCTSRHMSNDLFSLLLEKFTFWLVRGNAPYFGYFSYFFT